MYYEGQFHQDQIGYNSATGLTYGIFPSLSYLLISLLMLALDGRPINITTGEVCTRSIRERKMMRGEMEEAEEVRVKRNSRKGEKYTTSNQEAIGG